MNPREFQSPSLIAGLLSDGFVWLIVRQAYDIISRLERELKASVMHVARATLFWNTPKSPSWIDPFRLMWDVRFGRCVIIGVIGIRVAVIPARASSQLLVLELEK